MRELPENVPRAVAMGGSFASLPPVASDEDGTAHDENAKDREDGGNHDDHDGFHARGRCRSAIRGGRTVATPSGQDWIFH